MQFAHPADDGLTGFFVRTDAEGRIFFGETAQRIGHFFLIGFGLGFNRNGNNRLRELDRFKDNGAPGSRECHP